MAESLIYQSPKSKIYFVDDHEEHDRVALKILNYEFPNPSDIAQFFVEDEILGGLKIEGVRNVIKTGKVDNRHAIYLEWFDGKPVNEVFKNKAGDILDFLHIAIAISKAVFNVHQHQIIHKDICGANILVNLGKRQVNIIDFGNASKFALKQKHLGNPGVLEGTLHYCSPEQTGRMNRIIDHRSDLYSMGVLFYQMISGVLPFNSGDPLELVHAHIAQTPTPVHEIRDSIPEQLGLIINKLLKKNAEHRYQTARGVQLDLEECLRQFESSREILPFPIATEDFSGKFQIPEKLYGRDQEIKQLEDVFEKCSRGASELLLIAGYSGTGKTALVYELHKSITAKHGFFIGGKFDQYHKAEPYFAILQALEELIDLLLIEPEEKLASIKSDILEALGKEGKVMTNALPKLEFIIGEQAEIPELGGEEARNRFFYVMRKFLQALTSEEHPIAMFIDDLQWADSASLQLLKNMMVNPDRSYLLCIGAYRDNEVGGAHPLLSTIEEIEEEGSLVTSISIGNLSRQDVLSLVQDSLNDVSKASTELTDLIYKKTHGNAFFVNQFLKSLYEEDLLNFDFEESKWTWDIQKIEAKNISDNVVELLTKKIQRISIQTLQALKSAACIGNSFALDILSFVLGKDEKVVKKDLLKALKEELLILDGSQGFKFAHDRIQQAAYTLIPEQEKSRVHWDIGNLFLQKYKADEKSIPLFDLVNQMNFGVDFIEGDVQEELAVLNLKAGQSAKLNSAFPQALSYFKTGIGLLKPDSWKQQRQLTMDLYTEATETAYLSGDYDLMERNYQNILRNSKDVLANLKAHSTRILAYKAENKLIDSINVGKKVLAQLGERFPRNPRMYHILLDYAKTLLALRGKDQEDLLDLPEISDPYKSAAIRMMNDLMSSAYWAIPNLAPLLVFRMIRLTLQYGTHPNTPFALGAYGVLQCGIFGAMRKGQAFLDSSVALMKKLDYKEWQAQIYVNYSLIPHWNMHVRKAFTPLKESYHIGLETGAIEFACVNTQLYCTYAFLAGVSLDKIEQEARVYSESFLELKQDTNYFYNETWRAAMLNFMGHSTNPLLLTNETYDEEKMIAQNIERNDKNGEFFIWFCKMMLCYFFRDFEQAADYASRCRELLDAVLSKFEIPNHHFYEALTEVALAEKNTDGKRRQHLKQAKQNSKKLKQWSKYAPENYLHKAHLINAEIARVSGKWMLAADLYNKAIEGAIEHGFLHEEALAYELAGCFNVERGSSDLSKHYFYSAHQTYQRWGAMAKAKELAEEFPSYISEALSTDHQIGASIKQTISRSMNVHSLDISTVLKASTAISGEVVLPKLLTLLVDIIMENAGAQRCILLLKDGDELYIEAEDHVDAKEVEVLQHLPFSGTKHLPIQVIQYVERSREHLVLHNASQNNRFQKDDYIRSHDLKSVICLPIINQGKFIGVLYLENNATTYAFTKDRINLLALLSGQIAVSIDNAILYQQMDEKVKERTIELAAEKERSDTLLHNILPVETAEELKVKGRAQTRKFDMVTVLFTDFVGFTRVSTQLTPEQLVDILGECFSAFDNIVHKYKVEKIKTIGDAYMAAGGLPVPNSTNPIDCVRAAIEMREWINDFNRRLQKEGKPLFEIRIGLHTGPIVAGVVGTKKFAYDIWGDVVNTASRMESNSEPGKINISGETYNLIKEKFSCTYRGKIKAKNKGEIDMYFIDT